MTTALAFLFVALGITLDAIHNYIRRECEGRAYNKGYKQAQKEENIRVTTVQKTEQRMKDREYEMMWREATQAPMQTQQTQQPEGEHRESLIPDEFWTELQTNGRAVTRIQK